MKIKSLIKEKNQLIPVDVELTLSPGLPGIQFIGLPDQHVKESGLRIKSAIKNSGFQFPVAQQILVNLSPSHLKKNSRGLDLAVAAAYLWETGQVEAPLMDSSFFVYGELSLTGEVFEPDDLSLDFAKLGSVVLTGGGGNVKQGQFRRKIAKKLAEITEPTEVGVEELGCALKRPEEFLKLKYSKEQAFLLKVLATGEHSALLAGAAGSGKSTIGRSLISFLRPPELEPFLELCKIHREFGNRLNWRPFVKPHHSTPMMAMIGGGSVPFAGEISRAHGGLLILDELLEFSTSVQESLREPFEERVMRVYRAGKKAEYPADTQIISTTNLCTCGRWTPALSKNISCNYSNTRCRGYLQRLSGPLVDRFEILHYSNGIGKLEVSGFEILEQVQIAQKNSEKRFNVWLPNAKRTFEEISETMSGKIWQTIDVDKITSQRRKIALARVARTIADLSGSNEIQAEHLRKAYELSYLNFERLKNW